MTNSGDGGSATRTWLRAAVLLLLVGSVALWATQGLWRPAEVELVGVEERDVVETLLTTGRVTVRGMRDLSMDRAGRVRRVAVEEGDRVEEGHLLMALDAEDLELAVAGARAVLADAEARLEGLRRRVRPVALVALEQAQLERARTERELERAERMETQGIGSAQAVDNARAAARAAELAEVRAAAELRVLGAEGAEVLSAMAQREGARVTEARAMRELEQAQLLAPVAGILAARRVEEGAVVSPGEPLLTLAPDGGMEIRIQPDERELAHLAVGQRAWVRSEVLGDVVPAGRLARILPVIDAQRGTLDARIVLDDTPPALRPNQSVDVEVELRTRPAAPVVPITALRESGDGAWVFAVVEGRLVRRAVRVGWRGQDEVALEEGLRPGDQVVRDAAGLEEGRRVRVADEAR